MYAGPQCLIRNAWCQMCLELNFLDVRKLIWCVTASGLPANNVVTILTVLSWLLLIGG